MQTNDIGLLKQTIIKCRDCDVDSKPTHAILFCLWERHFTELLWQIESRSIFEQFETIINIKRSHNNFIKRDNRSAKSRSYNKKSNEVQTRRKRKKKKL